jgi:hypothetical protein
MADSIVTAFVPKKHNHVWTGKGNVVSIDLSTGLVILHMTSGEFKGCTGGFNIDALRFNINRKR